MKMNKKMEAYGNMSKSRYEFDEKRIELEGAQDKYREELVNETVADILKALEEDGKISERDLKLFLGDLALQTKQIYYR